MNTYPHSSATTLMATNTFSVSYLSWLKIVPLAFIVTAGLIVFMERLIHMTEMVVDETPALPLENVVWEETIIEVRKDELPKTPEPVNHKPVLPPTVLQVTEFTGVSIPRDKVNVTTGMNMQFSMQTGVPIAQYLAAAQYPARALNRGIEGYVDVMFDVTEYGGTDNIQVLAGVPDGIFDSAAVKSVATWRFQPKTYNDKPVRFEGMRKRVRFEIQK